jgi:hypothetical protein
MFHTRAQLINWLENNAPDRIISNAVNQGEIELLGGFHPVAGSSYPGFIVRVYGGLHLQKIYYIGIVISGQFTIRSFRVKEPNWKDWIGYKSNNPLYMGDNYEECEKKYQKAIIAT